MAAESEDGAVHSVASRSSSPFVTKLSHFARLSSANEQVLDGLSYPDEAISADADIAEEGITPRSVFLLKEGMAIRYRTMPNGGRQIMTFLIPGDLCDMHVFLLTAMDHSIATITPVRIARISRQSMMDLVAYHPRISAALWWSSLQEQSMLRERIVTLGRRDAHGRVAYLLCELLWRHAAVGLVNGDTVTLPLTQAELGDALGLTSVHINRVIRDFRESGLIHVGQRKVSLLDVAQLQSIAGFDKAYLNFDGASEEVTHYFDQLENEHRHLERPQAPKPDKKQRPAT